MMLDDQGRADVFAYLQSQGFTGTRAQWWRETRRRAYESELRVFERIWLGQAHSLLATAPEAREFLSNAIEVAKSHFDRVRSTHDFPEGGLSFSCIEGSESAGQALRLSGLCIDVTVTTAQVAARCMLYVAGEFRRQRTYVFPQLPQKDDQ